jgi:protein-S-isoprenylcysteine O-methyltransferase Ste14
VALEVRWSVAAKDDSIDARLVDRVLGERLATSGPYAYVRHPQYVAFIVIMFGFLMQWPMLVTLVMFPMLVTIYVRLARREELEVRATFGAVWDAYAADTPPLIPRLRSVTRPIGRHPKRTGVGGV